MLFQNHKQLYQASLSLFAALLLIFTVGTIGIEATAAEADTSTDMTFSLELTRDTNGNYVITVGCRNNTPGVISSVYAYLPLDSRLEYQYFQSTSSDSYVRRAVPERLEIAFTKVSPGACATVQVFLKRVPNSVGSWTVAAQGHWDGEPSRNGVLSNTITIDLDGSAAAIPVRTLDGGGSVKRDEQVSFSGGGFFSNERVSLWINLPDGSVRPFSGASTTTASSTGRIEFIIELPKDAPFGDASVVAFGQSSKQTSLGFLTITE